MNQRQCYHCKQWISEGELHDCWTTTEAALTRDLGPDLLDAWERLRETAAELGDQRIYASHNSIMFSRRSCYFFVRPKRRFLEVCVFLGREVQAPQISRVGATSKTKFGHIIKITHRDQVEAPIADWLSEAYAYAAGSSATSPAAPAGVPARRAKESNTKRVGRKTANSRRPSTKTKKTAAGTEGARRSRR